MAGGAEANKSGQSWEAIVKAVAELQGFSILSYKLRETYPVPIMERRIVWTHVPYETIFHDIKKPRKTSTEYVVECRGEEVRIECKWQSSSGSVDEKYPFVFLNAVLTMKERVVVLALGGEYFETERGKEVRNWLKKSFENPPDWLSNKVLESLKTRELMVLTTNNFGKWFRDRFPK